MKVVLTGKPDIGKTTIAHIVECEFAQDIVVGVDAIDIMKSILIPQPKTHNSRKCYQRALYHMQVELENMITDKFPHKLMLCDHGTLDCLSMWPESPQTFFNEIHSSIEEELARYDWVIQINGSPSSHETLTDKMMLQDPQSFWKLHPRFLSIPSNKGFTFCYSQTAQIIQHILRGFPLDTIRQHLT